MNIIRPADEILDQPYWNLLATTGKLHLSHCENCGAFRHPPGPVCPECRHIGEHWAPVSGRATLRSYTEARHPVHDLLKPVTPYIITMVQLEEGPRLVSGVPHGMDVTLTVGMPLQCQVVRVDERFALPYFLPIEQAPK